MRIWFVGKNICFSGKNIDSIFPTFCAISERLNAFIYVPLLQLVIFLPLQSFGFSTSLIWSFLWFLHCICHHVSVFFDFLLYWGHPLVVNGGSPWIYFMIHYHGVILILEVPKQSRFFTWSDSEQTARNIIVCVRRIEVCGRWFKNLKLQISLARSCCRFLLKPLLNWFWTPGTVLEMVISINAISWRAHRGIYIKMSYVPEYYLQLFLGSETLLQDVEICVV